METWIHEVLRDPASARCGAARRAIFDAVGKDRGGPVTGRLLAEVRAAPVRPRLLLLELLGGLCGNGDVPWPGVAAVAVLLTRDPDAPVRRAAAWLLTAADHHRAVGLLTGSDAERDPVARTALAEALLARGDGPDRPTLRADRDPAIRLRATLRPDTDAVLADLDAAGARLGGAGGRVRWGAGTVWGLAATRSGDAETCYADIGLLAAHGTVVARRAAVDMAAIALREWRTAPQALVPHLRPLLGGAADPGVRAAAAAAVAGPMATTRLCAEELARLLDELPDVAAPALARIGDVRALPRLCGLVGGGTSTRTVSEGVDGLARAGCDLGPLVAAAADFLDRHAGAGDRGVRAAVGVLRGCGPAAVDAVPQLLRVLASDTDGATGPRTLAVLALGGIGPGAAAAVPLLDSLRGGVVGRFTGEVEMALIRITGDRRRAERVFAGLPEGRRDLRLTARLLEWLAGHGGLEPRHVAHLREACADPAGRAVHPGCAGTLWRHEGDAVAELALDVLLPHVVGEVHGVYVCTVLGAMGASAARAVPALREVAGRRERVRMYIGDFDEETRADERLAAAARAALCRIAGAPASRDEGRRRPPAPF
ncbi:hypothetical protein [Streptomyces sp. NPDC057939]|uniref:hypothetical protein n=1 Tax=Streptomyces sp. NPDC057939 TaxID=3346284 RepID=UPI0036E3BF94